MAKLLMTIKSTSVGAHFDGLADLLVLCGVQCQMQHVQGYCGIHWMPPSGNYLLCIAPGATWATANKKMMKKCTNFAGRVGGHGNAPGT
jgi:hypothetical protein